MLHPRRAALLRASVAGLLIAQAACAHAPAAFAFEVVPRPAEVHRPHRAAWACAIAGAGLLAASFPLTHAADERYHEYMVETDPSRLDGRWDASVRADRIATGSVLAGEVLLATATWLGFVHRPHEQRLALEVGPARCALSCRF